MTRSASSLTALHRRSPALALVSFLLAGGIGCYRAAGVPKNTPLSYEIPSTGGDRVAGMKSTGGPGDYYLGNDYVQMAVDGAPYGERQGQFGAASGGAILDISVIGLDQSFHRASMPSDNIEQLVPVVNQDPELPLVFDTYRPSSTSESAVLEMRGGLLDPKGKLGLPLDDNLGRVHGIEVVHTITLYSRNKSFDLRTTLINHTAAPVQIYSLGDYLHQRGGGFRILVPGQWKSGFGPNGPLPPAAPVPVRDWGVQIPVGSNFDTTTGGVQDSSKLFNPLASSVQAYGLGLQGGEPSAETLDFHQSLGIASLDTPLSLVASDKQDALHEVRPIFPSRVVVGSIPTSDTLPGGLPAGHVLTHNRRIHVNAGNSVSSTYSGTGLVPYLPSQTTIPFNEMAADRKALMGETNGGIYIGAFGTASRGGAFPTEIRFESYNGPAGTNTWDPQRDLTDDSLWTLESVEWLAGGENSPTPSEFTWGLASTVPQKDDSKSPSGHKVYRVRMENRLGPAQSWVKLIDTSTTDGSKKVPDFIVPPSGGVFVAGEELAPERTLVPGIVGPAGSIIGTLMPERTFLTREQNSDGSVFQPGRVTVNALDALGNPDPANDPSLQAIKLYYGSINAFLKAKFLSLPARGVYSFRAGNQVFGASFLFFNGSQTGVLPFPLALGKYQALASRGPLNPVATQQFTSSQEAQGDILFRMANPGCPEGWTSFDLPSPTQATTGGMVPAEMLTSALAEGVQVVARTEEDRLTSPTKLYTDYRLDFMDATSPDQRALIGQDPLVVGARSSTLWNPASQVQDGRVTALFTPEPTTARMGGARSSARWTLADFLANADGAFNVIHRPRDPGNGNPADPNAPEGLLQARGFNRAVSLGSGVNAWWNQTSPQSAGRKMGDFDALELLRAEYSDASGPKPLTVAANATAWFNEFQTVRQDWFAILKQQTPSAFTKALGLSGAKYSLDTPVGLARTYLKLGGTVDANTLGPVLDALRGGHAVASTGPFLDVTVGGQGPGGFLTGTNATAALSVTVIAPSWVPVDEVRVVVNGTVVSTIPFNASNFTRDSVDDRKWVLTNSAYTTLTFTPGKDAYVIVEAGVPLSTTGAYAAGTPWAKVMHGIYPIAVTNPVFVDVDGGGYTKPGL